VSHRASAGVLHPEGQRFLSNRVGNQIPANEHEFCMFINLMFNLLQQQKSQSNDSKLSPCVADFVPHQFSPTLIGSSKLSKGALEFHPESTPSPVTKPLHSDSIVSLVNIPDQPGNFGVCSYVHLCFPSTRVQRVVKASHNNCHSSSLPVAAATHQNSLFSTFQSHFQQARLASLQNQSLVLQNILFGGRYLPFSSPRSFNSQAAIDVNHVVKKKKKKANLNQKVGHDPKFLQFNLKKAGRRRNLNVSVKFKNQLHTKSAKRKLISRTNRKNKHFCRKKAAPRPS